MAVDLSQQNGDKMAIPKSVPVRFTPRGLCDAYDATDVFNGACRKLINLVFDQSNPEIVVARPGVGSPITSFAGFTSPQFISVQTTIGDMIYGMVKTSLTVGKDQPFCYNLATSSFVTVSGCTAGNAEGRPASPPETGDWTPPTMAVIGVKIIITHPGYTGAGSNFFGVIDISNPFSPSYTTANTATNALPSVPTSVANFNNRAYFSCGNITYYSDVLVPTTMTNASQSLTLGDSSPITALSGLPVQTSNAGVISALLVFKKTQIWQIIGDAAISGSLAQNYLSLNIGTSSPRSVVPSTMGTFFAGPDACYVVNSLGAVHQVTADSGNPRLTTDIRQPFGYCRIPSRVAAAFAGNVYRICLPTTIDGIVGTFDYWFDTRCMRWNGPHTFSYDCASSAGTYFILSGYGSTAKLFKSFPFIQVGSLYTDDTVPYNVWMKTADFPKMGEMEMKQVVESTIELSSSGSPIPYNVNAYDDKGDFITSTDVTTAAAGKLWGSNIWGDGSVWQSSLNQPRTYQVFWPIPLVFNKIAIQVIAVAASNVSIGTFKCRTQKTGYTLQN